MAVAISGWTIVVRRARIELVLDRGLASWFTLAPNRTACADADVCAVSFMAQRDAAEFALQLEERGLAGERDGNYRDFAIVDAGGPWQHGCAWLAVGRYGGVEAAWSTTAADPEPLVVPLAWRPSAVARLSAAERARLEVVRRDGNIEVLRDPRTGEEYYVGRASPPDRMPDDAEAELRATWDELAPLVTIGAPPRRLGFFARRKLAKGIHRLERVATGDRWRAWWFLGMARRSLGDDAGALTAFEHAYRTNPTHADVARELAAQYLAAGDGARAVTVCERNCSLHPANAGLRANLALACVIADDVPRARTEVARALALDGDDRISRALATLIDDVLAGRQPRPTKYP